jgi:hypothetical protein
MQDKFRNKYRIPSSRLQGWDYSGDGAYFITICSVQRQCLFGDIIDNKMMLSPIGEIVVREWEKSFEIRSELFCDAFIIMPNHLHAILWIENNNYGLNVGDGFGYINGCNVVGGRNVETHGRASLQIERIPPTEWIP